MTCGSCQFTDTLLYCSMPPKVKCKITNEYRCYDDECNCEDARAQKEAVESYLAQKLSEPIIQIDYTDVSDDVSTLITAEEADGFKGLLNQALYADPVPESLDIAVGCTRCLVCGADVILSWSDGEPKICPTCQKAIKFIKEKFKKELDEYEV